MWHFHHNTSNSILTVHKLPMREHGLGERLSTGRGTQISVKSKGLGH